MTERRVEQVMGMPVLVDVRDGTTGRTRSTASSRGCASSTRPSAPTARTATSAASTAASSRSADAHPLVREVLARCERCARETGGYFDARAAGRLDPSGLVKGWAVDRAAALLSNAGASRFCVNAGGDVVVRGGPWRVGVQHPRQRDRVAAVLALTDAAVATSGAYERGEHIVDPSCGRPPRGTLAVTVLGRDLATADAYATAAFAMGERGPAWTARLRGCGAMTILAGDRVLCTERFLRHRVPMLSFAVTTSVWVPAPVSTVTSSPRFVVRVFGVTGSPSSTALSTVDAGGQRVADRELGDRRADLHARDVGFATASASDRRRRRLAEADRASRRCATGPGHLRHDLEEAAAGVGPHAELLVHDGPRGAVVAPRLEHHRALGELAVDRAGRRVVRRRARSPASRRAARRSRAAGGGGWRS